MRIFASPSRYIQGENALFENAKSILDLGNYPILLCDQLVYDIVGKRFEDYLHRYGFHIVLALFNGEASDNEINRVVALAENKIVIVLSVLVGERRLIAQKLLQI
ncbi:3-dehydroquinate synthase [Streptococcus pneumoniae]|nr:3-dehydroquinate synthase [Streptococcus pneumoniae]